MRAVLCGYYGQGNGGDEALLATLLQMLPPTVTPVVLSGNPQETYDRYGVEACPRKRTGAVLKTLRRADAFIWGGGSLMQDATSALSPLYYAGLMGLAQQLGLVTIAWAQGIGPLQRSLTRWLTHRTFAGCTAVSVRDAASAKLLQDWQIPCTLAPDPVWALQAVPMDLSDLPQPRIAVSLRPHRSLTPGRLQVLTQALVAVQRETGAAIVLVPFQPIQDQAIALQIQTQLPGVNRLITWNDPRQLVGLFQEVDLAISMRFHGLVMAAAAGCACVALSYDPKVSQLMQELTLPGWELDQLPESSEGVRDRCLAVLAQGAGLDIGMIQAWRDRALIHQDLLVNILNSASNI